MSLVARHLEENGIPTLIIGSALDIVEHCGVARYLFVDFPLGNPCGKPWDKAMQSRIMAHALDFFARAERPTTEHSPETWGSDEWRVRYMEVSDANREALALKGEELRAQRATREPRA